MFELYEPTAFFILSIECFNLCFRDLQKATHNFTTVIGQGAFGPVYKAQMSTGETVAVKVLATNSKQGEKEFQTEVKIIISHYFEMHRSIVSYISF